MRRSTISIPSNIVEGYGRQNRKENSRFVNIAY
ncbi:MAG: four helix bundle protein [Candidatus Magasanikbacteria bacterium]